MELPDGWLAPRSELFVEDAIGFRHIHAFTAQRGALVAKCETCDTFLPIARDVLREHARQHHQLAPTRPSFETFPKLTVGEEVSIRAGGEFGFIPSIGRSVGQTFTTEDGGIAEITSETISSEDAVWTVRRMQ